MSAVPELKQILGALVFGAKRPLTVREVRRCLEQVAAEHGKETSAFAGVKDAEIKAALDSLAQVLDQGRCGFTVREVAGSYRLQSDGACGKWLRHLLSSGRPHRLSRPALETLAIIAYRQPVSRSEIEGVRGVSVDHVLKTLMEMQLVRITGRSDLPGRPLLYGTTHAFLKHFGLKNLKELDEMEPMLLMGRRPVGGRKAAKAQSGEEDNEPHEEEDESG